MSLLKELIILSEGTRLSKLPAGADTFIVYYSGDDFADAQQNLEKKGFLSFTDMVDMPEDILEKLSDEAVDLIVDDTGCDPEDLRTPGSWPLNQFIVVSKKKLTPAQAITFVNARASSKPDQLAHVTYL